MGASVSGVRVRARHPAVINAEHERDFPLVLFGYQCHAVSVIAGIEPAGQPDVVVELKLPV